MADNVTLNAGSGGDTVAADDVSGVKYQVVKLAVGADGSASLVSNSNPIPISDAGGAITVDGTVAVTGVATAANQSTGNTALGNIQSAVQVMDDWDESDRAKVNPIVGQAGVAAGAGAVGATTQRVTLASDDPAVALLGTIDTDTGGIATSTATTATQTTNAATSLAVLDDWDESDRAKVNPIVGQAGVAAGAGAVGVTVQRMTLASDDPAVALLGTIDADTSALAATISAGRVVVDGSGVTQPVSGTVTAAGAAAHGAAVSGNPVLVGVEARTTDGTAVDDGDVVRAMADAQGKLVTVPGALHTRYVSGVTNITDTAADDLIAAAASTRTVVTGISVTNKDATVGTTVSIRDGTTVKVTAYAAPEGGGFVIAPGAPIFVGTANTAITAICGTDSSDCDITVWGYQIPG